MDVWKCECGQESLLSENDERIWIGEACFRKPGCPSCKRPVQLSSTLPARGDDEALVAA